MTDQPNLTVCRPADEVEVKASWVAALTRQSPTAIVLSRQSITSLSNHSIGQALKGGYVLEEHAQAEVTIFATGSECSLACEVATILNAEKITTRVVSLMSWELFFEQSDDYQKEVIGSSRLNVSIEAQSSFGWERFIGSDGLSISVDDFGVSAPYAEVQDHIGFTSDKVTEKIKQVLSLANAVQ